MATFLRSLGRTLAVAVAAGVFLALVGALGSGETPLVPRLTYWVGLSMLGAIVGSAVARLLSEASLGVQSPWLRGLVIITALTPIFMLLTWLLSGRPALTSHNIGAYLGVNLVMTSGMTALMMLAARRPPQTHAAPAGSPPPRFLQRLPPKLRGGELYAVESQDHYLRLHTSKGQDLILLRLSDALAELEGVEGAQTHRSWWVAKDAVDHAKRGDGRATLTLKNGLEAPVSRAYARVLREAGWY